MSPAPPRSGPPRSRPLRLQPDRPRRRAVLLAAITVVALVPVGIGFGISLAVGGPAGRGAGTGSGAPATQPAGAPTLPTSPPVATLSSGKSKVTATVGSSCWTGRPPGRTCSVVSFPPGGVPVLSIVRGATVTLAFTTAVTGASPVAATAPATVSIAPGGGKATPLRVTTPVRFNVEKAGRYGVSIQATWGADDHATYVLRFDVS